jgi:hypothetical protein
MILKSKQEIRTNYNTNQSLLQYLYWRRDAYLWLSVNKKGEEYENSLIHILLIQQTTRT